jgi:hypothetical protein
VYKGAKKTVKLQNPSIAKMESKALLTLQRLVLLSACLIAATALPNLDFDHLSPGEYEAMVRSKRRAETSSSNVLQYMEQLRNSLSDEEGKPRFANSDDPTEVWGIQDVGELHFIILCALDHASSIHES